MYTLYTIYLFISHALVIYSILLSPNLLQTPNSIRHTLIQRNPLLPQQLLRPLIINLIHTLARRTLRSTLGIMRR